MFRVIAVFLALLSQNIVLGDIAPKELQLEAKRIINKIPEFVWLQQEAKKRGVKVWLFGGTASTFAHYVRESLEFDRGDDSFYPEAFAENSRGERDYLEIYRPAQDIDLVVDGSLSQVKAFEEAIQEYRSNLQDFKEYWEVRSLREDYRDKLALLNNPDFFNQHTDSHSVGMVNLETGRVERLVELEGERISIRGRCIK